MKRLTLVLLMTLVSSLSLLAQTAKTRRPALPSDIAATAGQDSDSLLKNPAIKARMEKLLGSKQYASFMESFETLTPVTKRGTFLFSTGCLIHACTHLESAIAIDLVNKTIHVAIFRQNEKTRYFNEDRKRTPEVIRDWANNLSQLNNPANSSEAEPSLATPDMAAARVEETTPLIRLRSVASVRGFIGGESHDSYVVHARKGSVLTVRLSWRREGDNRASLTVSESPNFSGEPVKFGNDSNNDRKWVGRIPKSGDYHIEVVAHPSAHYTLHVSVR
jgi:hypothetical protein